MYDANLGRWMSPDPYGEFHSPYLAMGNNPVSIIDPDGGAISGGNAGSSSYNRAPANDYDHFASFMEAVTAGGGTNKFYQNTKGEWKNDGHQGSIKREEFEKDMLKGLADQLNKTIYVQNGIITTGTWVSVPTLSNNPHFEKTEAFGETTNLFSDVDIVEKFVPDGRIITANDKIDFLEGMNSLIGASGLGYDAVYYGQKYSKFLYNNISSTALKVGSKITFWISLPLTGMNANAQVQSGKSTSLQAGYKASWDVGMGAIGYWGGPLGFGTAALYFTVDQTVGWSNFLGTERIHPNWSSPNSGLLPVNKR